MNSRLGYSSLFFASLLFLGHLNPVKASPVDDVRDAVIRRWEVTYSYDAGGFDSIAADEYKYFQGNKNLTGSKTLILNKIKDRSLDLVQSYELRNLVVNVYGNTAVVHYTDKVNGVEGKTNAPFAGNARTMEFWVYRDGRWQIVARQDDTIE